MAYEVKHLTPGGTYTLTAPSTDGVRLAIEGADGPLLIEIRPRDGADWLELSRLVEGRERVLYAGPLLSFKGVREEVCPKCGKRWEPKVEAPDKCPACSYRLRLARKREAE